MKRRASAIWNGNGLEGKGAISTQSGAFNQQPFSFTTRFKDEEGKSGTNPEELIAAAHAGCFSMALSFQLAGAGFTAESIQTDAVLTMENDGGWTITAVALKVVANVPGIDEAKFLELAEGAKKGCPISKVLNAEITLDATLVS